MRSTPVHFCTCVSKNKVPYLVSNGESTSTPRVRSVKTYGCVFIVDLLAHNQKIGHPVSNLHATHIECKGPHLLDN